MYGTPICSSFVFVKYMRAYLIKLYVLRNLKIGLSCTVSMYRGFYVNVTLARGMSDPPLKTVIV